MGSNRKSIIFQDTWSHIWFSNIYKCLSWHFYTCATVTKACNKLLLFQIWDLKEVNILLVHLSRGLKCIVVTMRCPSSVVVNLSHFRLPFWNRWTKLNKTLQEVRSQRPLPSSCFEPIGKTRWPSWHLICWDIFGFSSESLNGIQRNFTGRQTLTF